MGIPRTRSIIVDRSQHDRASNDSPKLAINGATKKPKLLEPMSVAERSSEMPEMLMMQN